jgi:hypothetical protein
VFHLHDGQQAAINQCSHSIPEIKLWLQFADVSDAIREVRIHEFGGDDEYTCVDNSSHKRETHLVQRTM